MSFRSARCLLPFRARRLARRSRNGRFSFVPLRALLNTMRLGELRRRTRELTNRERNVTLAELTERDGDEDPKLSADVPAPAGRPIGEKVRIPHEEFLPVERQLLVRCLQEDATSWAPGENHSSSVDAFHKICAMAERIFRQEYLPLERELCESYELFSATKEYEATMSNFATLTQEEIEARELQLVGDFAKVLEKANFHHIRESDLAVCDNVYYNFRFPVRIKWEKFDGTLIERFFAAHPQKEAQFRGSDEQHCCRKRCLVFKRGVGVTQTYGFMFAEKVDEVLSRITAAAKKPFRVALSPITMLVSRIRGRAQYEDESCASTPLTSSSGKAKHIHKPRYVYRVTLRDRLSSIGSFFSSILVQEPTHQDVVMLYRPLSNQPDDPKPAKAPIYIKLFRNVPMADLKVIFPEKDASMKGGDLLQLVITGLLAAATLFTQVVRGDQRGVVLWAIMGSVLALLFKLGLKYITFQRNYQNQVAHSLYTRLADAESGVIVRLVSQLEEQEFKEFIVGYALLWRASLDAARDGSASSTPISADELDAAAENYFKKRFGVEVDFEVDDALAKLRRLDLLVEVKGRVGVVPPLDALRRLASAWRSYAEDLARPETPRRS